MNKLFKSQFLNLTRNSFINKAIIQNIIVGFICFCCPGMFNALNGIGGGGLSDPTVASNANTALYISFCIFGLFGGAITNFLGMKYSIFIGSLSYCMYTISLLLYNLYSINRAFVIFFGFVLGFGAAILWTAQGCLMMSYPNEKEKGKFISLFWVIFNFGGMIGGIISLLFNLKNVNKGVTVNTYIAFACIMGLGSFLSLFLLVNPKNVVKTDKTRVKIDTSGYNLKKEIIGTIKVFKSFKMLMLLPIFLYSNFFYTYQFNCFNDVLFDVKTRSLNNSFYWGSQMLGSIFIGYVLDLKYLKRKQRGLLGLLFTFLTMLAIWIITLFIQLKYNRNKQPFLLNNQEISFDKSTARFIPLFFLYVLFGVSDAIIQNWSYWVLGSLTNNSNTLATYSGYYKGVQSLGAAISWGIDSAKVEYLTELIINFALFLLAIVPAFFVSLKIENTSAVNNVSQKVT